MSKKDVTSISLSMFSVVLTFSEQILNVPCNSVEILLSYDHEKEFEVEIKLVFPLHGI